MPAAAMASATVSSRARARVLGLAHEIVASIRIMPLVPFFLATPGGLLLRGTIEGATYLALN
jgi:hypothetical protein